MTMISVSDEVIDSICVQFRALIEEFGVRNVAIALPRIWEATAGSKMLGDIEGEFCTEKHIIIRASHSGGCVEYCHQVI